MPLTYYSRAATQDFWSDHWAGQDVDGLLEIARSSPLTGIIEAALPPAGRILEAGCGLGQYVILMRERGRAATGADWSLDALERCRAAAPGTPLAVMDLGRLAVRSGAFDAYVSLGVVEHDPAGPARILAEAARVLAPGGRLILSVPYWNGVRKLGAPHLIRQGRQAPRVGRRVLPVRLQPAGGARLPRGAGLPRAVLPSLRSRADAAPRAPVDRAGGTARRDASRRRAAGIGRRARAGRAAGRAPALRRIAYSGLVLRMCAHMILAVAERP